MQGGGVGENQEFKRKTEKEANRPVPEDFAMGETSGKFPLPS